MAKPTNITGLSESASKEMAKHLNDLLANYQLLYINTRGYHWNIKGTHFFELHELFETIYDKLLEQLDEIAERILTLGHIPDHSYSDYLQKSIVQEHTNATNDKACVEGLFEALKLILTHQRDIIATAHNNGDDATIDMLSDYILHQEICKHL